MSEEQTAPEQTRQHIESLQDRIAAMQQKILAEQELLLQQQQERAARDEEHKRRSDALKESLLALAKEHGFTFEVLVYCDEENETRSQLFFDEPIPKYARGPWSMGIAQYLYNLSLPSYLRQELR